MAPHTIRVQDKLLSERLARLPLRVSKSNHSTMMVSRSDHPHLLKNPHAVMSDPRQRQPWYRPPPGPPATNLRIGFDHLRSSVPSLHSCKRVTKMQVVDSATDHIQQQVLDHHLHMWRTRGMNWTVNWSSMNMVRRAAMPRKSCVKKTICSVNTNPSLGGPLLNNPYLGQFNDPSFNNNLKNPSIVCEAPTLSPVCLFSSPPSVDSGYDTAECSPASTLSSPGEGLGYVEEIDQFLDSFEFGPHNELINSSIPEEVSVSDEGPLVDDQAVLENILLKETQGTVDEVEESIENIEECVKKLTGDQSQTSQEVTMYDVNGKNFTVLQLDPVF